MKNRIKLVNGIYEFNIMIDGKRHHKSFKGFSKKEVEEELKKFEYEVKYCNNKIEKKYKLKEYVLNQNGY